MVIIIIIIEVFKDEREIRGGCISVSIITVG